MIHFHSGVNTPGYLPEGDLGWHDTAEEAWRSLAEEIERAWDSEYAAVDEVDEEAAREERLAIDARYLDAHTTAGQLAEESRVYVDGPTCTHLGWVYWVTECSTEGCDEDGTSGQDRKSYTDDQDRKSYTTH